VLRIGLWIKTWLGKLALLRVVGDLQC
jgi:hypothetical protein